MMKRAHVVYPNPQALFASVTMVILKRDAFRVVAD